MTITKKITQKADDSFVDDWKQAWKWLSVQFSLLIGFFVAYVTTDPEGFAAIMESLPQELRIPMGFIISTAIPIYLRLKKQGVSNLE